jgi:stage III sporulation protein AH
MVLKKQTVWLLTMLSLIIVLSVFYISSPDPMNYAGDEEVTGENTNNNTEGAVVSDMTRDEAFIALQMQREEKRSMMQADYLAVIASNDVTAEAKSQAYAKLQELTELAANEAMLEQLIRAHEKYDDVIVTTSGNRANIIVKASDHSKKDAAEIMLLGLEHLGNEMTVMVEFLPNN